MVQRARASVETRVAISMALFIGGCCFLACCSSEEDSAEICGNGLDDNGNQLVDCDDPECIIEPSCSSGGDADSDADADADDVQDGDLGDAAGDADIEAEVEADVEYSPVPCEFGSADAHYTRDYDSAPYCTSSGEEVLWSLLYWDAEDPGGATTTFCIRTADDYAELGASAWVLLAEYPGDESPADIAYVLSTYGMPSNLRYLELAYRVESAGGSAPAVTSLDLIFYCDCPCDDGRDCSDECECDSDC